MIMKQNQQELLNNIVKYLGRLREQIKIYNGGSEFSINVRAENILKDILNVLFDCNLTNANYTKAKSYPSIDLIDENKKIAFQITSTSTNKKVQHTLNTFIKNNLDKDIKELYVYILTDKQKISSYNQNEFDNILDNKIVFDTAKHILDKTNLYDKINEKHDFQMISKIEDLLEKQFSDFQKKQSGNLRILHVTDLKFDISQDINKYNSTINELISDIKTKGKIDVLIFTGDILKSSTKLEQYDSFSDVFTEPLIKKLNISRDNIFFCAGNHDINRIEISDALLSYFSREINTNEKLNEFVTEKGKDYLDSLKPISNFYDFTDLFYPEKDVKHKLLSTHIREINNKKIGVISINSSWISSNGNDKGSLLFPVSLMENAIAEIKTCDYKFLLTHHPLYWFKKFNFLKLQEIIHKEFDLIFTGHNFKEDVSQHYLSNNGIYTHALPLSLDTNNSFGYSILNFDFANKDNSIEYYTFENTEKYFKFSSKDIYIPNGKNKEKDNNFRNKIKDKFLPELSNANELLLNYKTDDDKNFLDLFVNPVIKTKSKVDIAKSSKDYPFKFEQIYNPENYFIYGQDKSGKTSILKRIQLRHLDLYTHNGVVPFYIDYKDFEQKINGNFTLIKLIANYYQINQTNVKEIINKYKVRLLIDNFDPNNKLTDFIKQFIVEFPMVKYVICSDEIFSRTIEHFEFGETVFSKLYIHDLSRKEIRKYTETWEIVKTENTEEILERIVILCKQLQMPVNYWTVSLFLMIYNKTSDNIYKNVFEVLDLAVDELLGKKYLTLSKKNKIDFSQLKKLSSELAYFLLKKYRKDTYSADYSDILIFLKEEIDKDRRLTANPKEIFDYLINSGILKQKTTETQDVKYTFRLNGIFEYFLAYYLIKHPEFKDKILEDDNIYLAFKNEFIIYSGYKRNDEIFLKKIYEKTKQVINQINKNYDNVALDIQKKNDVTVVINENETINPDIILSDRIKNIDTLTDIFNKLPEQKPLEYKLQDKLKDEFNPLDIENELKIKEDIENSSSEVLLKEEFSPFKKESNSLQDEFENKKSALKLKKPIDTSKVDSEIFEKYISILAKVLKNSTEVTNDNLIDEIFDFLLKSYPNYGFTLIDEINKGNKDIEILEDKDENEILMNMIAKFVPLIVQALMVDSLGHFTMEEIIKDKINKIEKSENPSQYELFLLYFLLIDIDVVANKKYLDKLKKILKTGILKFTYYLKLNFYMVFKAYNNPQLEKFLSKRIKDTQISIQPKTNRDELNKFISKKENDNVAKRWQMKDE